MSGGVHSNERRAFAKTNDVRKPFKVKCGEDVRGFGSEASTAFRSVAKSLYTSLLKKITERKQEKERSERESIYLQEFGVMHPPRKFGLIHLPLVRPNTSASKSSA